MITLVLDIKVSDLFSLLGAFGGALISGLIAIAIFWKQSENEKKRNVQKQLLLEKQKKDYLKGSLHHFIAMVQTVLKDKKDTFEMNAEYAQKSADFPFTKHVHKIEISGTLSRLLELNPKEIRMSLIAFFGEKEKAFKSYATIYNVLDFYNIHGTKSKQFIFEINKENYHIQLDIKKQVYDLRKQVADYTAKVKREGPNNTNVKLYESFNSTLISYVEGLETAESIEYHRNNFAKKLLLEANSLNTGIIEVKQIFHKAHEIVMLYFDLEQKGQEMRDTILNSDAYFQETNDKLEKILNEDFKEFLVQEE